MLLLVWLTVSSSAPLSLQAAISEALERAPEARQARALADEAAARKTSATGALGPRIRLESGVQVWNRPLDVQFVDPTLVPPMLAQLGDPVRVREPLTATVSVSAVQPLTGLYPLLAARTVELREVDAQAAAGERTRHELAYRVVEAYAQALTAEAAERTAQKAIELTTRLLERAEQVAKAGLVAKTEVLRAKAALASAQESALNARTGVELSHAALQTLLKREEAIALVPFDAPLAAASLDDALTQMRAHRPELREIASRVAQSEQGIHVARSRMVPELAAVANYTYTYGNKFAATHQLFVGGALNWDVWEWGAKFYQIEAAQARINVARLQLEKAEDLLRLEVRQAHTRLAVAQQSIAAAQASRDAAEAFLQSEEGRFGAGQTTATDLTLAQTQFLQAENNLASARYRALVAVAGLDKAIGRQPLTQER